jgi:Fe2+ or Zn2+ uptake regulation protein
MAHKYDKYDAITVTDSAGAVSSPEKLVFSLRLSYSEDHMVCSKCGHTDDMHHPIDYGKSQQHILIICIECDCHIEK